MRYINFVLGVGTILRPLVGALLEERLVSHSPDAGALDIANARIVADQDDYVGVHIALRSLQDDYEQITGTRPDILNTTATSLDILRPGNSILVGSLQSALIQRLSSAGILDVEDLKGQWEMFKTVLVQRPESGIGNALVLVGSDKRGTIFGIHTLAEQSGQSP